MADWMRRLAENPDAVAIAVLSLVLGAGSSSLFRPLLDPAVDVGMHQMGIVESLPGFAPRAAPRLPSFDF